jgi:hypothetical protein
MNWFEKKIEVKCFECNEKAKVSQHTFNAMVDLNSKFKCGKCIEKQFPVMERKENLQW